jgi:hypothetical protein
MSDFDMRHRSAATKDIVIGKIHEDFEFVVAGQRYKCPGRIASAIPVSEPIPRFPQYVIARSVSDRQYPPSVSEPHTADAPMLNSPAKDQFQKCDHCSHSEGILPLSLCCELSPSADRSRGSFNRLQFLREITHSQNSAYA